MAGDCVPPAALLVQPHPEAAVLRKDILDRHTERSADPGEGIDHEPDQRAIAPPGVRRDIDAVEQRARMLAAKNSRKRIEARSPAAATSAGGAGELIGTSLFMGGP